MVIPTVMSTWNVAVDGLLITKEESLVVHFACCGSVDCFNHRNDNCSVFVIELGQACRPAPAIVSMWMVQVVQSQPPLEAISRGRGCLTSRSCYRGLTRASHEACAEAHQDLAIFWGCLSSVSRAGASRGSSGQAFGP